jgi:chromosome segregation ATPase
MSNKEKEIFGLHKVPDRELLKQARIELGKANSYIEELEDRVKELTDELTLLKEGRVNLDEIKLTNDDIESLYKSKIKNQSKELSRLNETITRYKSRELRIEGCRVDVDELIFKYDKLKVENEELSNAVARLNKKIELLQRQLINYAKDK